MFVRFQLTITEVGSDNDLAPNKRQAIIWTNDDPATTHDKFTECVDITLIQIKWTFFIGCNEWTIIRTLKLCRQNW